MSLTFLPHKLHLKHSVYKQLPQSHCGVGCKPRYFPLIDRSHISQDSRIKGLGRTIENDYAEIRAKYREPP